MAEQTPSCSCCCRGTSSDSENRRGFLGKATTILCGAAALAAPVTAGVVTFLNPLRQKSQSGQFMRLASLELVPEDGTPLKVPVIADRTDAWVRYPLEPIGAVFLRRNGKNIEALQASCPHAGCSINYDAAGNKFFCPCHSASFDLAGKRTDATSPSPRDMDTLKVEVRDTNEVFVKYETFKDGTAKKIAQA